MLPQTAWLLCALLCSRNRQSDLCWPNNSSFSSSFSPASDLIARPLPASMHQAMSIFKHLHYTTLWSPVSLLSFRGPSKMNTSINQSHLICFANSSMLGRLRLKRTVINVFPGTLSSCIYCTVIVEWRYCLFDVLWKRWSVSGKHSLSDRCWLYCICLNMSIKLQIKVLICLVLPKRCYYGKIIIQYCKIEYIIK